MFHRFPRILPLGLAACLGFILLVCSSLAGERTHVTLLSTTDVHGRIFPIDYFTNQPEQLGLAKLSTMIAQVRGENPELLLVDVGDCIQGTPLVYYYSRKNPGATNPMMLVMNELRYDALIVGNHEYNFGNAVRLKAQADAHFPWLSANTVKKGTDEPAYVPYLIKEVSGVRVGILGLTTPGIPYWEDPANYAGLEFRDPVETAKQYVPILREREKVDLVIVAMHMGLDEDLGTGRSPAGVIPGENAAILTARQVPGIDVILMGHTHRDIPALVINGVLLTQADRWGKRLGRVDVTFEKDASLHWQLTSKSSTTIPVTAQIQADPKILALAEPYHKDTQAWLSKTIGHCDALLDAKLARFQDSAIIDLVQRTQLEAGDADVSLAASFDPSARIPGGDVTVRDIYSLYVYENTLVVLEANGRVVKEALEHAVHYFLPYEPGKQIPDLVNQHIPGYSYDMAEGVNYEIDLTRPYGDRIRNLTYHGKPLAPDQKLRLVTNNYRFNGGGGYTMLKGLPVLQRSSKEVRELILEWVEKHGQIPSAPTNNWRFIPLP
jgi:2',3'-cyclic-nucleotide 2'-phosphodiesterase/3'-nucleotidase